tara:strand:- start:290 stop:1132 length:843 start_codon:yes stop_codon:yes gene_type:complete
VSYTFIKSNAKINIHLGVLNRMQNHMHEIETIAFLINLHDKIYIKEFYGKTHKIKFYGKFSKGISNQNTVSKLFKLLDDLNLLNNKKFIIKIEKNIPLKSGMGGGSMNAASLLNYFIKKFKLKINTNTIHDICNKIGSDVILGLKKNKISIISNNQISYRNNKIKYNLLIVKPNYGCNTRRIYNEVKNFSLPLIKNKKKVNIYNFKNFKNDLETSVFRVYPNLLKLKKNISNFPNISLVRMTGSGSALIAYYNKRKDAQHGLNLIKKNYKKCWCILSKAI